MSSSLLPKEGGPPTRISVAPFSFLCSRLIREGWLISTWEETLFPGACLILSDPSYVLAFCLRVGDLQEICPSLSIFSACNLLGEFVLG